MLVVLLLILGIGAAALQGETESIEKNTWLVVDLYGDIPEYDPPGGVLSEITGGSPETLTRILDNMEKASVDERIEGVILKMSSTHNAGSAKLQEIRGAIRMVQASGKKVLGFADSMNRGTYYLAAACDSIYTPRTAYITFTGMAGTSTHIKGALEKLGINPNFHKIKDYKSAAELLTRKDLSEPAKENIRWLMDEQWEMYNTALTEDRGLSEKDVIGLMEHALFTADEAVEGGLVDRVLYWDELEGMLKLEDDDALRTVSQERYADVPRKDLHLDGEKVIAVIHAQGTIGGRESRVDPLLGIVMGHESVAEELRNARMDENVAAIVFRVDSPGGESLASDLISREVQVTAGVKPVVASMVDVAASGGYMVSYRATKIVADPITVTGSIGSISGKFNIKKFHDKLGITHDFVEKGPMGLIYSSQRDFTDKEWERFTEDHWAGFNAWLRDVAEFRGMTFEEAEKLAHGRVWTGRQAVANGLIDELGDLNRAIQMAKELAGLPLDENVTIAHYPVKEDLIDAILSGNFDLSAAVRMATYRMVREEFARTWDMLTGGPLMID